MDLTTPNIDRLLAAFGRKKHDRVPNFEIRVDPGMVQYIMGWPDDEAHRISSLDLSPVDAVEYARRTCQDAIGCYTSWWLGLGFEHRASICAREDIEKIRPPDKYEYRRKVQTYLDATKGTNIGVWITAVGPFMPVYTAMGPVPIQSFMLGLYDDLPLIEQLMDIQQRYQIEILEAIADLPIAFIYVSDDVCGNTGYFVSSEMMDRIWTPRIERLVQAVSRAGVPIIWHCCGKLDSVLPLLVDLGVTAINPVQPSCNNIYSIKNTWGEHLCLIGNMNIEGVLAFGAPEDVIADTKDHIHRLSDNGGYVVASSHSIVDAIPPENYFAMIHAAQEYGQF
jgi:uroporphyrinogen-III decarboxylase